MNYTRGGKGKGGHGKAVYLGDIAFGWEEEYKNYSTCNDGLVFLSEFDRNILHSCFRFAKWPSRWLEVGRGNRDHPLFQQKILPLVECTELKLANCLSAEDLVKSNLLLIAAITGQPIDFSNGHIDGLAPEDYFKQYFDFSQTGVANRLGPETPHAGPNTIQATLLQIQGLLETLIEQGDENIEDELTAIAEKLVQIGIILGV